MVPVDATGPYFHRFLFHHWPATGLDLYQLLERFLDANSLGVLVERCLENFHSVIQVLPTEAFHDLKKHLMLPMVALLTIELW